MYVEQDHKLYEFYPEPLIYCLTTKDKKLWNLKLTISM